MTPTTNGKLPSPPNLEQRLAKAGISPDELADVIWRRMEAKVVGMLKHMADRRAADRQAVFIAVLNGLAVRWSFGSADCTTAERLVEQAERLTDEVMRQEARRTGR